MVIAEEPLRLDPDAPLPEVGGDEARRGRPLCRLIYRGTQYRCAVNRNRLTAIIKSPFIIADFWMTFRIIYDCKPKPW